MQEATEFLQSPELLALVVAALMFVCNVIARLIPDTATGVLGNIRKIAAVIGVKVENRVAPGITPESVVKSLVTEQDELKNEIESQMRFF